MHLYLLRHAHALEVGEAGIETDEARPLSDEGRARTTALAGAIRRLGVSFDVILSSPLLRAQQTAEELSRVLSGPPVQLTDHLGPGQPPKKIAREMLPLEADSILLVGHEPDLGRLTGYLIGDKGVNIAFAKGAMACIRSEVAPQKGCGELIWLITPKWIQALSEMSA